VGAEWLVWGGLGNANARDSFPGVRGSAFGYATGSVTDESQYTVWSAAFHVVAVNGDSPVPRLRA
jgi:hypothetical protein